MSPSTNGLANTGEGDARPHGERSDPDALLRALADPQNRDWSLLYHGSVLDD